MNFLLWDRSLINFRASVIDDYTLVSASHRNGNAKTLELLFQDLIFK